MKTKTLLIILNVITWIVFIALLIKAGAMLFLYGYSLIKPEVAGHLYKGLNMLDLRQTNFLRYTLLSLGYAASPALQAYIAHIMIGIFTKMNLESPFTVETADRLRMISVMIITMWIVSFLTFLIDGTLHLTTDHLFTAGLTFIISEIFRRGVEMQSEQELTV
jgi:hypothetical protein